VDKAIPLDYLSAEVELERLKALREWIDEERIWFESRKIGRRSIPVSQGENSVEPPKSIRQGGELNQPVVLEEVSNTKVQVPLSALLTCVPNLKTHLIAWLENERGTPQDEFRCDFIEEGTNHQKIVIASWEGDASNVMLPITYKNYNSIPSIVNGGSSINIISKKLYDAWDLPKNGICTFLNQISRSMEGYTLGAG